MLTNTKQTYGTITRGIHWLMAAIFLSMYTIAYIMINISKSDFRMSLYDLHKATGLLLFALVAARLIWRLITVQPNLPTETPKWQKTAAHGNIILLYLLMFAMPLTGFLTSTLGGHDITFYHLFTIPALGHNNDQSEFFADAHELFSVILIAAFTLHVLGSLYHHYIVKDDVMKKMLF